MPTVGTTVIFAIAGTIANPVTFELHADADNSDTINYSAQDPTVSDNFGELLPGQSLFIDDFIGSLYLKGEASGLLYGIPVVLYKSSKTQESQVSGS